MRALWVVVGWALLASRAGAAPASEPPKSSAAPEPPAVAVASVRLALAPLLPVKGMSKKSQGRLVELAEAAFQKQGLEVLGPAAISAALGSGRARGCAEPDCLLGFARAVEAPFVAHLSLGPARKPSQLTLSVLDAADGSNVTTLTSPLSDLKSPKALAEAFAELAPRAQAAINERNLSQPGAPGTPGLPAGPSNPQLTKAAAPTPSPSPSPSPPTPAPARVVEAFADTKPTPPVPEATQATGPQSPARSYLARKAVPLTLIGLGVCAAGVGGAIFGMQANGSVDDFRYGRDAAAAREDAKRSAVLFDLSVGVGSAVALTGAALLLFVPDDPVAPSVGISAAPNGVSVQGVF